jgi:hypothetical protein
MAVALALNVTTTQVSGAAFNSTAYRITAPPPQYGKRTFQMVGSTSAGAGAATATIQVSNNGTNWLTLGVITLVLGTSATSDGFASDAVWENVRVSIAIGGVTGTNGSVTVLMGV